MKMICPYCSKTLKPKNIMFRCMNDAIDTKTGDRKCQQVDDEELSEYNKLPQAIPGNLVFPAKGFGFSIPKEAKCPACNTISKRGFVSSVIMNCLPFLVKQTILQLQLLAQKAQEKVTILQC